MVENNNDLLTRLSKRLKDARRTNGLTLEAVAKLSGVSRSMVSQIERCESSPTIATLWNISRVLNVDFTSILNATTDATPLVVTSPDQIPTIENMGEGCRVLVLSPPDQVGQYEIYDLHLLENGMLNSQAHKQGTKEHLTVIDGDIEVTSGAVTKTLSTGHIARYAADVPHQISAVNGPARAFLVVEVK